MGLTTDPNDPELGRGPGGRMNKKYLVLSDKELEQGFVRPVRTSYVHATCGGTTSMSGKIAETYAREPKFYGYTFCCQCGSHFPVGEFTWYGTEELVGS